MALSAPIRNIPCPGVPGPVAGRLTAIWAVSGSLAENRSYHLLIAELMPQSIAPGPLVLGQEIKSKPLHFTKPTVPPSRRH